MYRLPDQQQGTKYIITDEIVEGRQNLFELKPERRKKIGLDKSRISHRFYSARTLRGISLRDTKSLA